MNQQHGILGQENTSEVQTVASFLKLLKIIKIARSVRSVPTICFLFHFLQVVICRMLKLARHSDGVQALGYTFKTKKNEFGLLMLFMSMGALFFASLVYLAEKDRR